MFTDDVLPADLAHHELIQQRLAGHDTRSLEVDLNALLASGTATTDQVWSLLRAGEALEPALEENWEDIEAQLPTLNGVHEHRVPLETIRAAWLGRVIGNTVGKPIEWGPHWNRTRIKDYLVSQGAYPLGNFVPVDADKAEALLFRENWPETTLGRVNGSSRDDDIDYTVLALCLVETHGTAFTTEDVAEQWLQRLPFHQVYTAERAAYRNLVNGVPAKRAALSANPYREWIGALIRADFYGYINPGNPRAAAKLAYQDARLSHVSNGLYGAMWAAALIAEAFVSESAHSALAKSLKHIPATSALANEIATVTADFAAGLSWEEAVERIEERGAELNWVHTVNNAGVICAGLLWGEGDFTRTVCLTVQAGLDTDSNGATAGSVAGVLYGLDGIPGYFSDPIKDRLRSAVFGFNDVSITDLAERTQRLMQGTKASQREPTPARTV